MTAFARAAECFEDGDLAEGFEWALPVDVYLEKLKWATERRARTTS